MKKENKIRNIFIAVVVIFILFLLEGKLADILCASKIAASKVIGEECIGSESQYLRDGNRFVPDGEDPQVTIISEDTLQVNRVVVTFQEKMKKDTPMQVYYDDGNGFSEDCSVHAMVQAGCKEAAISIPAGSYGQFRLDIEGEFVFQGLELSLVRYHNNVFKNMIFWGCAILVNLVLLFVLNKKLHVFEAISLREQFGMRRLRLTLWGLLFIAGFICINSLYIGEGQYYAKRNDGNGLLYNVKGYELRGPYANYTSQGTHSADLNCPEDSRGMVLFFASQPEKDIVVKYTQLGADGKKITNGQSTVWKKGTESLKIEKIKKSCAKIRISIPKSFALSVVYYKISKDDEIFLKIWLGMIFFILSYGMSTILLCSIRVAKGVSGLCEKCIDIYSYCRENYKNIFIKFVVIAVSLFIAIFVNYLGGDIVGWKVTGKSGLFFLGIVLLVDMVIFLHGLFREKLEWIGFLIILIVGSLFVFLSPPYLGISWDDETHYRSAVELSHFMDRQISKSDEILLEDFGKNAIEKERYSEESQIPYNAFLNQLEDIGFFTEDSDSSISVRQIVYIPSALGLILGRGMGMPFHLTVILGKWMNVWLLAILSYFAMKRLKSGKIIVLLVALIPTNIFIASNYTYDTWIVGWSIFGLSAFFGEWQRPDEKIGNASKWMIALALLIAVIAKESYFIITCIALFMPDRKFGSRREAWIYRGLIIGAMLVPFILLYFGRMGGGNVATITDSRGGEAVSSSNQLDFVLQQPQEAFKILLEYLKGYLNPFKQGFDYLCNMAYMGIISIPSNLILGTLLLGALFSREEKEPGKFPWWFKLGIIAEWIGIGTMSAVAMYILFTPVGAGTVEGCQGRYLLPAVFPAVFALSRFSGKTFVKNTLGEENLNIILLGIMIFCGLQGLWGQCLTLF